MREFLNADTLFNTIAMLRPERDGAFLVVEGSDDEYTLERHVDSSVTIFSGLGGKSELVDAAVKVGQKDIALVYFVVDSDYDRLVDPPVMHAPQVVASDTHDLVMDLIFVERSAIHNTIRAHVRGNLQRRSAFVPEKIVADALGLAFPVGLLRLLSVGNDWGLKLRDFPFGKLKSSPPDPAEVVELALSKSPPIAEGVDVPAALAGALDKYKDRDWSVVGDHDFFAALAKVLKDSELANGPGARIGDRVSHAA